MKFNYSLANIRPLIQPFSKKIAKHWLDMNGYKHGSKYFYTEAVYIIKELSYDKKRTLFNEQRFALFISESGSMPIWLSKIILNLLLKNKNWTPDEDQLLAFSYIFSKLYPNLSINELVAKLPNNIDKSSIQNCYDKMPFLFKKNKLYKESKENEKVIYAKIPEDIHHKMVNYLSSLKDMTGKDIPINEYIKNLIENDIIY